MNKLDKRPDLIEKTQEKNNKRKNKIRFYYSFLTIVLLICLVQIGISAFNNITKSISYHGKIKKMKALNQQAYAENQRLKEELEDFSSLKALRLSQETTSKWQEKTRCLLSSTNLRLRRWKPKRKKV